MPGREVVATNCHPDVFPETPGEYESVRDWLVSDPSFRYRVRDGLASFDIKPEKDLGLGYTRRPYIDMNVFAESLNIPIDPESPRARDISMAFLEANFELRDDYSRYTQGKEEKPGKLDVFRQLPSELQILATLKVLDSHWYRVRDHLLIPELRQKVTSYFVDRLGVSEYTTQDILQGAAIVFASSVLEGVITDPELSTEITGVDTQSLAGPSNPSRGMHLGLDLENATSSRTNALKGEVYLDHLFYEKLPHYVTNDPERLIRYQEFWPKISTSLNMAVRLSGKPEEEAELWKAYLFAKAALSKAFEPRTAQGFDGGLDQLTSWRVPVEDQEYDERMSRAEPWLEIARRQGFDTRGIDLARQGFAIETIDQLDVEVATNAGSKRNRRIQAIANIVTVIQDQELIDNVLRRSPTLYPAIARAMDPYGYRFK